MSFKKALFPNQDLQIDNALTKQSIDDQQNLADQPDPEVQPIDTSLIDNYADLVNRQPKEADFKPGLGRKIGAGLASALTAFSGDPIPNAINVGRQITEGPYKSAMDTWEGQVKAAQPLLNAGIGTNKLQLYKERNQQRLLQTKADILSKLTRARQAIANANALHLSKDKQFELQQQVIDLKSQHDKVMAQIEGRKAATGEKNASTGAAREAAYETSVANQGTAITSRVGARNVNIANNANATKENEALAEAARTVAKDSRNFLPDGSIDPDLKGVELTAARDKYNQALAQARSKRGLQ